MLIRSIKSISADSIPWPATPRFAVVAFIVLTKKIPGLANIKGIHCIHGLIDQCRYTIGCECLKDSEMSEIKGVAKLVKNDGLQINLSEGLFNGLPDAERESLLDYVVSLSN